MRKRVGQRDQPPGASSSAQAGRALAWDHNAYYGQLLTSAVPPGASRVLEMVRPTHRAYPVLPYFQYRDRCYEVAPILLVSVEATAMLRIALYAGRYSAVLNSVPFNELDPAVRTLLHELVPGSAAAPVTPRADRGLAAAVSPSVEGPRRSRA